MIKYFDLKMIKADQNEIIHSIQKKLKMFFLLQFRLTSPEK